MHPGKSQSEHIDEFHKLVGDLVTIDTAISDEDQALLLLTSLPSSYDNFMETLLNGWDTLKLEDRDIDQGTNNAWSKSQGRRSRLRNEDQVSGSRADEYDSADVMMAMSVEEPDWIMDSGGSYYMKYKRDYLINFEEYDGGNVLLGENRESHVQGTGIGLVQVLQGVNFKVESQEDHAFDLEPQGNVDHDGLKEDMDARSHAYVLSDGCKKSNDEDDGYY
ncbi:hypothetical protein Tco_1300638 [Tanacetum coccineum]